MEGVWSQALAEVISYLPEPDPVVIQGPPYKLGPRRCHQIIYGFEEHMEVNKYKKPTEPNKKKEYEYYYDFHTMSLTMFPARWGWELPGNWVVEPPVNAAEYNIYWENSTKNGVYEYHKQHSIRICPQLKYLMKFEIFLERD